MLYSGPPCLLIEIATRLSAQMVPRWQLQNIWNGRIGLLYRFDCGDWEHKHPWYLRELAKWQQGQGNYDMWGEFGRLAWDSSGPLTGPQARPQQTQLDNQEQSLPEVTNALTLSSLKLIPEQLPASPQRKRPRHEIPLQIHQDLPAYSKPMRTVTLLLRRNNNPNPSKLLHLSSWILKHACRMLPKYT